MSVKKEGHCLCKATGWEYEGDESWTCYCHCDDCRRNCGAPVVAFIGVAAASFRWVGQETGKFESSPGVTRHFCTTCGSPMAFEATHYHGEIHLFAASLAQPQKFAPRFHVHCEEALGWLDIKDELPRFDGFYEGDTNG